ncbi:MAG: hypothetical protein JNJ59_00635 [Deltaproteobacteria bacterium]|jgi:hypothetical protein|nr:hypothetical protein [Deltaproteobacteria bacterium]
MSNREDELEVRLSRLGGSTGVEAALVAALEADAPFPEGARGARLLARAKAAIGAAPPSLATLIVRVIDGVLELVGGDGRLGEVVSPVAVRGGASGGVLVRHRLGDREVATHVDARSEGRFAVLLDFGSDAAARNTRVSLFSVDKGGREVASEVLRQGRVLLPELGVGAWRVEIEDSGGWVGELDLVLGERAA